MDNSSVFRKKEYNINDFFLLLLVASIAAGNFGGALQIPRLLAILFFYPSIKNAYQIWIIIKRLVLGFAFFLVYGLISTIWSPAGLDDNLTSLSYNIIHVLYFFEIILFSFKAKQPIKIITFAFFIAFIFTALIGAWELKTEQHLSFSKLKEASEVKYEDDTFTRYFAAATFYNFNTYVTYLCLLLPYLFYGSSSQYFNKSIKICFIISIIAAMILILYNGSRGGFLSFIIIFLVYIIFSLRSKWLIFLNIVLIGGIYIVLSKYGDVILQTLSARISVQGSFEEENRITIWRNVMCVVDEYDGLGCGPGSLPIAMVKYAHGGFLISHNIFLEILSQYGFLFFITFICYLLKIFVSSKRLCDHNRRICVYQAIISLPIIGIINSEYLTSPFVWTSMASLFVFANLRQYYSPK